MSLKKPPMHDLPHTNPTGVHRTTMGQETHNPCISGYIRILKPIFLGGCLCCVSLLAGIPAGKADIYVYRDNQGILHFSNTPTTSEYKIYLRTDYPRGKRLQAPKVYDQIIKRAAQDFGLSFSLLKSMIKVESDFDPYAVSKKGAKGLMQIMPENYQALSIQDPFDPRENIRGGARYFKTLLNRYNGKLDLALAAYNAGPRVVDKYQSIPPFTETKNFVRKVMEHYRTFTN